MTFTEIKTEIKDRLNLSSTDADTRVGRAINRYYKQLTVELGIAPVTRRATVSGTATISSQFVTFSGIEKLERVLDSASTPLDEVLYDELANVEPHTSDPTKYAVYDVTDNDVQIVMDCFAQTAFTLTGHGYATVSTLSGSDVPAFPESFHNILIELVLVDEYLKLEKPGLAKEARENARLLLSKLRLWSATRVNVELRQGGSERDTDRATAGGGSGISGTTSYTQSGLITFDRDPAAPFAVSSGSAVVPNLIAESAQGLTSIATDRLVGRDTAGTGDSEQITVGGGIEFTGSGGVQTSAFTGDVTKPAGGTAQTIANDAVTFAKMQNIATDRLIGRDTASSGDPEEISVGGGLEFSGSGGVQRSALTGDVTASAGSGATTIANDAVTTAKIINDAVTYAKLQNVSAASRLLGRGSASGAGDAEELTIGSGLSLSGTALAALITSAIRQIVSAAASGNFSTTSATLVDVTNAAISITTGASATVLVIATIPVRVSSNSAFFDWKIDGVDDGVVQGVITSSTDTTLTLFRLATGLSAASHTFQLRARSSAGGTINIDMNSVANGRLVAVEWR